MEVEKYTQQHYKDEVISDLTLDIGKPFVHKPNGHFKSKEASLSGSERGGGKGGVRTKGGGKGGVRGGWGQREEGGRVRMCSVREMYS